MSNKSEANKYVESSQGDMSGEMATRQIARAQVYATLAVAEQLERIAALLESVTSDSDASFHYIDVRTHHWGD